MTTRPVIALIALAALGSMGQSCENIEIASPNHGAVFTSARTVSIEVGFPEYAESAHVTRVDFLRNGSFVCADYSPPYSCAWPITSADNGSHSWIARAYVGAEVIAETVPSEYVVSIGGGPAPGDPELEGFVPAVGTAVDVAVDANRDLAFVASREFGLSVVDVSVPSDPLPIAATNPPFQGFRVATSGSLAVVSDISALKVVDVGNPWNPEIVGELATNTLNDVAIAGQYAYMLIRVPGNPAHVDLAVVDLTVPGTPVLRGQVTVPGWGEQVEVVGGRAYVAAGGSGLQVFSVSNPNAPYRIGGVETPGDAISVTVSGSYAYVGEWSAVRAVQITSPSHPSLRGQVGVRGTDLAVANGRLYASGGLGVSVLSLGNPAYPSLLGTDPSLPGLGLDAAGNRVYMAFGGQPDSSQGYGGLFVVNASLAPNLVLEGTAYGLSPMGQIAVDGPRAVVSAGNQLKVVDVTDPLVPELVGVLDTHAINDVAVSGQYGYVLIRVPGNPAHVDLAVVDLSVSSNPVLRGQVTVPGWGKSVAVVGNRAFVAAGSSGLQVFSVSNPYGPYRLGGADTPGDAIAVTVSGGYAYVGEWNAVHAIEIANPSNPIRRGQVGVRATDLAVSGSNLCASSGLGLSTISLTNPAFPSLVATIPSLTGQSSSVVGDLLFMAEWVNEGGPQPRGIARVVDISNPASPHLVTEVRLPGGTASSAVSEGRVFFQDTVATTSVVAP